jgi:hypothetical protein
MANWCSNRVTISTDGTCESGAHLDAVHAIFSNPQPFNAIEPEPDWATTPNSQGELPTMCERKFKQPDGTWKTENYLAFDGDSDDRWYNWRLRNWGCKWDLDPESNPVDDYEEGDSMTLRFETPWGPPSIICKTLRERYPTLFISWFFDEPGTESAGYL